MSSPQHVEEYFGPNQAGTIYSFDLVVKPVPNWYGLPCDNKHVTRCHGEVFQGIQRSDPYDIYRMVVNWYNTNCPRKADGSSGGGRDYSDQGEYCIYHVHYNLFSLF